MIKIPSKNISKLNLSNRGLTEFPKEVIHLKNLRKLNLSGNKISKIPKEIEFMNNLELLDLSNNLISSFYSKICALKKLKTLNLNNNKIKTIPIQIGNLQALENLQLASNMISIFPDSFSNLKNLKKLNLSKNRFENLPLDILKFKFLEYFWISSLPLKTFSSEDMIENFKSLKAIYCYGDYPESTPLNHEYSYLTLIRGNSIKRLKTTKTTKTIKTIKKDKVVTDKKAEIIKNKIFISYSHKDSAWLARVKTHLKVLRHNDEDFKLWDDTRIKSGDKWKVEIENALKDAGIAILIVSTDFLASDFIYNDELPTLLRNAKENGTRILSLIVKPCLFTKNKSLSEFQSVNPPNKPLSSLTEDQAEHQLVKLANDVEYFINS